MKILAIDLGKYNSVACLFTPGNQQPEYETIGTHRYYFEQLLAKTQPELVVMETCSITGWVHDLCKNLGYRVLVANPSQDAWRWKNVKRKTDKDDSLKLAKLTALDQIVAVHVPTSENRQYRHLVKYRKVLVGRVNTVQNNIRALFDQQGIHIPIGHRAWTVAGLEELNRHRKSLAECDKKEFWQGELDLELTALEQLWQQLARVDERLEQESKQNECVQLLMTIPGVGRRTAEVIVTCLDDPKRFKDVRQVSSYAGLVPKQHQSGQTNRIGAITRRGSRLLRTALVEVAWAMLRYNTWALETYKRICGGQKTRKKTAIVALARKLLVRCWAMLRDRKPWRVDLVQPVAS